MPSTGIISSSSSSNISSTVRGLYFVNWRSTRGQFMPLGIEGGGVTTILGIGRS